MIMRVLDDNDDDDAIWVGGGMDGQYHQRTANGKVRKRRRKRDGVQSPKQQLVTAGVMLYIRFICAGTALVGVRQSITYRYGVLPGPYQLTSKATFQVVIWGEKRKGKKPLLLTAFIYI